MKIPRTKIAYEDVKALYPDARPDAASSRVAFLDGVRWTVEEACRHIEDVKAAAILYALMGMSPPIPFDPPKQIPIGGRPQLTKAEHPSTCECPECWQAMESGGCRNV